MKTLKNFLIDPYIISALKEDITFEDVTTGSVDTNKKAKVQLIAKEEGILAGLDVFKRVFQMICEGEEEQIIFNFNKKDGDRVVPKELIGEITASSAILLSGERVALNYLQRMSGIATHTGKMVNKLKDSYLKLLDTRKTTPNMRIFEKYSVTVGGGYNHRYNLSDGVLLKDNHINAAGGVKEAIEKARLYAPFVRKIEVEVETLEMVKEAVESKADIIMLDNMDMHTIKEAVKIINGKAEIECSGNIDLENIEKYKNIGVDYISSGSLTYGSKGLDISMKNLSILE